MTKRTRLFQSGSWRQPEYRLGDARMLYVGPPSLQSERVLEISSIRLSDELLQEAPTPSAASNR